MSNPEPGWYEDPKQPGRARFWDGVAWGPEMVDVGWHDDPEHPGKRRYWDGTWWNDDGPTEEVAAKPTRPARRAKKNVEIIVRPTAAGSRPDDKRWRFAVVGVGVAVVLLVAGATGVWLGRASNGPVTTTTVNPRAYSGATTVPGTALVKVAANSAGACKMLSNVIHAFSFITPAQIPANPQASLTLSDYYLNYATAQLTSAKNAMASVGEYSGSVTGTSAKNLTSLTNAQVDLGALMVDLSGIVNNAAYISDAKNKSALESVTTYAKQANKEISALASARAVVTSLYYSCGGVKG